MVIDRLLNELYRYKGKIERIVETARE